MVIILGKMALAELWIYFTFEAVVENTDQQTQSNVATLEGILLL